MSYLFAISVRAVALDSSAVVFESTALATSLASASESEDNALCTAVT
jgi:hypothetical protein